jgi:sugar (pentulose or hexulose) kinase
VVGTKSRRLGHGVGRRHRRHQRFGGKALSGLTAIGFSGQMHGAALINRADKPVRPAILHNDGCGFRQADKLAREYRDLAHG